MAGQRLGAAVEFCSFMRASIIHRYFGSPASHLRSVACLEGLSYLLLLFVAMPLKYLGDMPVAVSVVGSIHGALFVWFGMLVGGGLTSRGRSKSWGARIMVAALLPFAMFFLDGQLKAEVDAESTETSE